MSQLARLVGISSIPRISSSIPRRAVPCTCRHFSTPSTSTSTKPTSTPTTSTSPSPSPSPLRRKIERKKDPYEYLYRSSYREAGEWDSPQLITDAYVRDPQKHEGTVIWLHGMSEKHTNLATTFQLLGAQNLRIVIPRAPKLPITALDEQEERAWYDLYHEKLTNNHQDDKEGIALSAQRILELLDGECEHIGSDRIILAGFAQGGAMAIHVGLAYEKKLAGIISFSGYVVEPANYPAHIHEANRGTPVLAIHGEQDQAIPIAFAKKRYDWIKHHGVPVEFRKERTLNHFLTSESLMNAQSWFLDRIARGTAKPSPPISQIATDSNATSQTQQANPS